MKYVKIIVWVVVVLAVAVGGFWLWKSQDVAAASDGELKATGVIEARSAILAPEVGGRVVQVLVEEGEAVTAGQLLVRVDDVLLASQRDQALAALRAAQANLALLEAGASEEAIAAAEAQLAAAEAGLRAAQANLYALTQNARPEEVTALYSSLYDARARYYAAKVVFSTDQLERVRDALVIAEGNLSALRDRRDDLAADNRNPAYVIAATDAALAGAQAAVDAAKQVYDLARDAEQPYYSQVELARQSWETAQFNLAQVQAINDGLKDDENTTPDALATLQATLQDARKLEEATQDAYEALTSGITGLQLAAGWDQVQRLQAALQGTSLLARRAAPGVASGLIAIESTVAQVDAATAQRDAAAANLASLRRGARAEEIEAARAQVEAAQAQVDALEAQLAKFAITAPWDGVVLTRSVEPGETVLPGTTLLEIGRLDALELTVFLPEDRFGRVNLGQSAELRVDAYPDRVFYGKVLRIADEAEFTPTNIQTEDDRVRLVYAVVILVQNDDLALKPGMIADVVFK